MSNGVLELPGEMEDSLIRMMVVEIWRCQDL